MNKKEYHAYILSECKRQWTENQEEVYGSWDFQSDDTKATYYNVLYEMYKENLEILNTMDSFKDGFKIERNGEIFTLTPEEMSDFRFLEKARDGRNALSSWSVDMDLSEEEETLVETMTDDEELCYNITQDFENEVFSDTGSIEQEVVKKYIEKAVGSNHKHIEEKENGLAHIKGLGTTSEQNKSGKEKLQEQER